VRLASRGGRPGAVEAWRARADIRVPKNLVYVLLRRYIACAAGQCNNLLSTPAVFTVGNAIVALTLATPGYKSLQVPFDDFN
jgi:hypothetical protein